MNKICRWLVGQAVVLPFLCLLEIVVSLSAPGYDSVSQHLSALGTDGSGIARYINGSAFAMGASVSLFALGAQGLAPGRWALSPLLLLIFGVSILSNGWFPMGSPMHGLHGIGMVVTIAPLVLAVEFAARLPSPWYRQYALLTTVASFAYLWLLVTGMDPHGFAGLTQRVASLVTYAWFAITAWQLVRSEAPDERSSQAAAALH